jgi:hypothetical protein
MSMMMRIQIRMSLLGQLDQYILKKEAQVMVEILTWQPDIPKTQVVAQHHWRCLDKRDDRGNIITM